MAENNVHNRTEEEALTFTAVKTQLLVKAPKANDAVQFYKDVFGAEEIGRTMHSKRKAEQDQPLILSAELKIVGFTLIISDFADESPDSEKGEGNENGVAICLETKNVEAAVDKAVKAGSVLEGEIVEGDGACCGGPGGRVGKLRDPYGFFWLICSPGKGCAEVQA